MLKAILPFLALLGLSTMTMANNSTASTYEEMPGDTAVPSKHHLSVGVNLGNVDFGTYKGYDPPYKYKTLSPTHWLTQVRVNYHYDLSRQWGLFTGASLSKVRFQYESDNNPYVKHRVEWDYTAVGVPLAVKFGNMLKDKYVYAGAQFDYAFKCNFAQYFDNKLQSRRSGDKISDQIGGFKPSLIVGIRAVSIVGIRFQYYPQNFLHRDYEEQAWEYIDQPYKDVTSKVMSVALTIDLGRNFVQSVFKK
ncbi:hypothetical protein LX64_02965 [Chitinophaga skermanii]|uniref:Outer membrane protein with beta-barrel domain n=1 Tax=Chitinophaga skermanii TaxID=331697 RepID=A0A327QQL9_9BACT|nr:hypothetical protein [Chitinophaga skermanii]RAJ04087.1 hypothetical protein LX64_02965 [Chitinophaga skermanii]